MEIARLVLDYLKAILSPQVTTGATVIIVAFLLRKYIGRLLRREIKVKSPGGYEISAPAQQKAIRPTPAVEVPVPAASVTPEAGELAITRRSGTAEPTLPGLNLPPDSGQETIQSLKIAARIWEYRYLNYFLVRTTQHVLDWFAEQTQGTTIPAYDAWWLPIISDADERRAIIAALQAHDLIAFQGELIRLTDKGREYISFRGALPPFPPPATPAK